MPRELTWQERITPDVITELKANEVFVFGSNQAGRHGAGAARQAMKWGAVYRMYTGQYGQTYAIPTKDGALHVLDVYQIRFFVTKFLEWAEMADGYIFLVTKIGCGLAGYSPEDIAPLFAGARRLHNVHLPKEFWEVINRNEQ